MASVVSICNQALLMVGGEQITSLNDGTPEAKFCSLLFNDTRDEVIADGQWRTAMFRASLNRLTTDPAFGFSFQFQLPTFPKLIKVLEINEQFPGTIEWQVEGDKLLADDSEANIVYMGRIEDPEQFGPYLQRALIAKLAAKLAMPITGDKNFARGLEEIYLATKEEQLRIQGQQTSSTEVTSNDLLDVR